jgi:hypothetical protein
MSINNGQQGVIMDCVDCGNEMTRSGDYWVCIACGFEADTYINDWIEYIPGDIKIRYRRNFDSRWWSVPNGTLLIINFKEII